MQSCSIRLLRTCIVITVFINPFLPAESTPDFGRLEKIAREIESLADPIVLVGHSLGASMLLKYLLEYPVQKEIKGVFLLATPLGCEAAKYFSSHELHKKVSLQLTLACLLSCLT